MKMKRPGSIYKITVDGKLYIGATRGNPQVRWSQHKQAAKNGNNHPLYCAMRRVGIDRCAFEVLEKHDTERMLFIKEDDYIVTLNTFYPYGYNLQTRRSPETWISARDAAAILTANTDHEISIDYVRMLVRSNKVSARPKNDRENEYLKSDVEAYHVRPQGTPRVRPRPSSKKEKAIA